MQSDALAFSKSLHAGNCLTFTFIPLRVIVPLRGTLSCAFGAALLQGPTHWGLSRIGFHTAARIHPPPSARPFSKGLPTSGLAHFRFRTASWIHPPPLARPFSKGLLASGLAHFRFHTASWIHPPPSARPFSKGLLASDYLSFAFTPLRRIGFKQSQTFLDDIFYVLPHVFEVVLDVEV